MIYGYHALFEF